MVPNTMRRRGSWRIAGDLPSSFRYAAQGLGYAFLTQRNFRIHVVTGLVVFGLATSSEAASAEGVQGDSVVIGTQLRLRRPHARCSKTTQRNSR